MEAWTEDLRFGSRSLMLLLTLSLSTASGSAATEPVAIAPIELVRHAVQNEMNARADPTKHKFRDRKETPQGSSIKLMVETRDAMAGLVIAYDDRPLGPNQRNVEYARLQRLIDDPDALKKKAAQERENEGRIVQIIKALPTAFLYEDDGVESGVKGVGKAGDEMIRLKFRPNPDYTPPTRVEQILTGMRGRILIDRKKERIARIDGTLQTDVSFGWGILGHLDRGGHILLEQGDDHGFWALTRMDLAFTGKLFLFKSINVKSHEVYSDFEVAPGNLTFAEGVELLKNEPTDQPGHPEHN